MHNPEIEESLVTEIIRLLDQKYAGGVKFSELIVDTLIWVFNNNISAEFFAEFFTDDLKEIIQSKPRNIDYIIYSNRGIEKMFIFLNSEVPDVDDTEEE